MEQKHIMMNFFLIKKFQDLGVGEIVLNSIDRDGMMQGYDFELVDKINL